MVWSDGRSRLPPIWILHLNTTRVTSLVTIVYVRLMYFLDYLLADECPAMHRNSIRDLFRKDCLDVKPKRSEWFDGFAVYI